MKRYYAVIDTNVVVSALLSKNIQSPTVVLLNLIVDGKIIPVYNEEILDEYRDVLIRKKFQFDAEKIEAALNAIRAGVCVERTVSDWHFPDEDDAVFYEVAMSVEDAYLVTGNIRHFPKVSKVVTPAEMIKIVKG
ncbi:MAG: putative toxin-antitoxin system toxin component, PIN family [Bacteroidales bacterium]|jgi:putative PIN family toxin of toxin-antitoxin system|nr:putative toxin-antitoxin system toxin component, PIN family [Bacteroidales bacterium]